MPMTDKQLLERDAQRSLGTELLQSVREMNAGKGNVAARIDVPEVVAAFKEPTVIKVLNMKTVTPHKIELFFSDQTHGIFDGANYLSTRQGPLLEALRDPNYFSRCFIDAGALCWPNGLELSATRLHELAQAIKAAA